uniref:G domain-containing protein n=1 Tax=Proboscia inermis TaxID=420281 RepID=A0A7S0C959_9STRA|mmetsp:Transcript_33655/g.33925  ORF Transcript_33655/g.33925 Transcript_33655/m.33925 type:complete len:109 (+) Transcript_33655:96-422(+)
MRIWKRMTLTGRIYGAVSYPRCRKCERNVDGWVSRQCQQRGDRTGRSDVAIVGPTNAGKSSLSNLLAQRDVAIVSSIESITRDVLDTSVGTRRCRVHRHLQQHGRVVE